MRDNKLKQRKRRDLYSLYKKALEEGRFSSMRDAGAYLCRQPAPCFYISPEIKQLIKHIVYFSLSFYIVKYFILFLYSIHKRAYLRNSWFECLVIIFLIISWIVIPVLHIDIKLIDYTDFENFFMLFVQIYFLGIVLIEISKASTFLTRLNLSPPVLMIMSFLILIAFGTLLLMLP